MSGSNIIIAMEDDLETEKINHILSSNDYHIIPFPSSENENSTYSAVEYGQLNSVDLNYSDSESVNLALIDEVLMNEPYMENVLEKINNNNPMPVVCITSDSDNIPVDSALGKNTLCLPRPLIQGNFY